MTDQLDLTDLRRELDSAGISDLDGLLRRLRADGIGAEPTAEEVLAAAGPEAAPSSAAKPMQEPAVDLIIDGDRHDAGVYAELSGRGLLYTPGVDARREPVLYGFTDPAGLTEHLAVAEPLAVEMAGDIGTSNPDSLSGVSRYFEHAGQGGDQLGNNPGRSWRDLTQVRRGFLGLGNWNDVISSVDWCRWDLMLYEHVGYGGARLFLRAGRTYNQLSDFGWNDVASATANFGTRR
jgi:hypothetical protein